MRLKFYHYSEASIAKAARKPFPVDVPKGAPDNATYISSDPLTAEEEEVIAKAWNELRATPKRVLTARLVQRKYDGVLDSIAARLRGEPEPPASPERLAKAEEWKQRIAAACSDPSTIDCGHEIHFDKEGNLLDVIFAHLPDKESVIQPFTIRVHSERAIRLKYDQTEIGAVAGN